jgi:hypothetical protein
MEKNQTLVRTAMESKKLEFRFGDNDHDQVQPGNQNIDLNRLAGCRNDDVVQELIASAALVKSATSDAQRLNVLVQTLAECKPKDLHESRLCLQASNLYSEGMRYLCKAGNTDSLLYSEFYMKSAIKLLRLHNETIETFNRHRRGGEQKIVVQHNMMVDKAVVNFQGEGS